MAELKIHRIGGQDGPPLYHRYPGQYRPQSAFLELDLERGDLAAGWNEALGNAVPEGVRRRRVLRWSVPIYLAGGEVDRLLDAVAPAARRLLGGAEIIWDGRDYVGRLTDAASEAEREIDDICSEAEGSVRVCTPEEWLAGVPTAELLEPGETVVHAAGRIAALAWGTGSTYLDGDVVSYLSERLAAGEPNR